MEQELFNPQSPSVDHWGSEYQYYGTVIEKKGSGTGKKKYIK